MQQRKLRPVSGRTRIECGHLLSPHGRWRTLRLPSRVGLATGSAQAPATSVGQRVPAPRAQHILPPSDRRLTSSWGMVGVRSCDPRHHTKTLSLDRDRWVTRWQGVTGPSCDSLVGPHYLAKQRSDRPDSLLVFVAHIHSCGDSARRGTRAPAQRTAAYAQRPPSQMPSPNGAPRRSRTLRPLERNGHECKPAGARPKPRHYGCIVRREGSQADTMLGRWGAGVSHPRAAGFRLKRLRCRCVARDGHRRRSLAVSQRPPRRAATTGGALACGSVDIRHSPADGSCGVVVRTSAPPWALGPEVPAHAAING
jgi:hypothetical protein